MNSTVVSGSSKLWKVKE